MAYSAKDVQMGVCDVTYKGVNLGYTSGFVKVSYSADSIEKRVDQSDAALDELLTTQTFEVTVPMAEYNLERFEDIFPGAKFTTDAAKKRLDLSGLGGSLLPDTSTTLPLVITPLDGNANDKITLHYAVPKPGMDFSFEKENVRVYEVVFKAVVGPTGWVTFGDTTVVVP